MRALALHLGRAFRDLDGFSDAEAATIVHRSAPRVFTNHGALVSAGLIALLAFRALFGAHAASEPERLDLQEVLMAAGAMGLLLVTLLLTRDAWLAGAIRNTLSDIRCHRCATNLVGLDPHAGRIWCPACEAITHLTRHELPAGSILDRRFGHPSCSCCSQPLGPFLPLSGSTICPRCHRNNQISHVGTACLAPQ